MDDQVALAVLAALSHPTRLATFKLLVRNEPDGLSTGELAAHFGLSQSTFSTHLAVLAKAGLVTTEKRGRNQIQRGDLIAVQELMTFLANDCCRGRADVCSGLIGELGCR